MRSHFEPPRQLHIDPGIVCCKTCGKPPSQFGSGGFSGRMCRACSDNISAGHGDALRVTDEDMRRHYRGCFANMAYAIRRDKAKRLSAKADQYGIIRGSR